MNQTKPTILIVDDETSIREAFHMVLQNDYNVLVSASGEAALKYIVDSRVDLVFLDIRMPGMDGIETLKRIKSLDDAIEVVMVTAVNDVQKARESIELGANNYIVKPFDVDQILEAAKRLSHKKILKEEIRSAQGQAKKEFSENELLGSSKEIKAIQKMVSSLSPKENPVLIIGENGCEKNIISNLLHKNSSRSLLPIKFIDLSIPLDDIFSEILLGEGKGTSVYELEKRDGLIEQCDGGTLVLNHVENLSPKNQDLLLDIMTKKESRRIGAFSSIKVDVRIISTSSKDLKTLADEGSFNKKLLNLFNHSIISIPPLRERIEDIFQIVNVLIERFNIKYNKNVKELSADCLKVLLEYSWPGNYEELSGIIEKIFSFTAQDTIRIKDLPIYLMINSKSFSFLSERREVSSNDLEEQFERLYIKEILRKTGSDFKASSQMLGINPSFLASKMEGL